MNLKYPELFDPFNIGILQVKNRIVMSGMHTIGWMDEFDIYTDNAIDYYEARAKGGVGLIYTGAIYPNYKIEGDTAGTGSLFGAVSGFTRPSLFKHQSRKLCDRVHAYGTKIFVQYNYGNGRVQFPRIARQNAVAISEGPTLWDTSIICRELTKKEIQGMIDATIEASVISKEAGFDGIDMVAHSGYMLSEFLTPAFNKRMDEYGGNLDGRVKVLVDMIKGVKCACGNDFPVSIRISTKNYMKDVGQGVIEGEEYLEYGIDVKDAIEIAEKLEKAGLDALYISNGCYDAMAWQYPPMYQKEGLWLDDVAPVTKSVTIPVISAGRILQPKTANDAIKEGKITAAALARQMLADAEWANKAKEGREEDIRPCVGCNNGCLGNIFQGRPMRCAVNADLFREGRSHLSLVSEVKKIAIIGGGLAGMECARIAAKRGHEVTIYERGSCLGGVAVAAEVPGFKEADRRYLRWFERELKNAKVKIEFNTEITAEIAAEFDADEIVVATGAVPKIPPIEGVRQDNVLNAVDALLGKKPIGEKVLVIGGGVTGCEISIWLQQQGKDVTLVESMPKLLDPPGSIKPFYSSIMMIEDMLKYYKVKIMCNTQCKRIDGKEVTVSGPDGEKILNIDTVVLSTGFNADMSLFNAINKSVPKNVWCLGDAKSPANIMFAIRDGNTMGRAF
jgi:2-enoate reductase